MIEIGIEVQMMIVERKLRRKAKMMTTTRTEPRMHRLADRVNRAVDEDGGVVGHRQPHARDLAVDPLDLALQPGRHLDGVLARLLLDAHPDAGLAVDADDAADVLAAVAELGDVAHVDRHAGPGQDDQVADVVEAGELAGAAQHVREVAFVDLAERHVLVLGGEQAR